MDYSYKNCQLLQNTSLQFIIAKFLESKFFSIRFSELSGLLKN